MKTAFRLVLAILTFLACWIGGCRLAVVIFGQESNIIVPIGTASMILGIILAIEIISGGDKNGD